MTRMGQRMLAAFIMGGLGATALAAGARAQAPDQDQAFEKRIFGHVLGPQRAHACFSRVYDGAHLAQHPHQNVRAMLLLVSGDRQDGNSSLALSFNTQFRTKGIDLQTEGSCGSLRDLQRAGDSGAVAHCGVDCDGGSIDVALKDQDTVLVTIPDSGALSYGDPGSQPKPSLLKRRFASDDKVFRLDRASLAHCLQLAPDEEKPDMRKGL